MMDQVEYNYKALTKKAFIYIIRAVQKGYSLSRTDQKFTEMINHYSGINTREKADLRQVYRKVYRAALTSGDWEKYLAKQSTYDLMIKPARRAYINKILRQRRDATRAMLASGDHVFYICSSHSNPRKEHREFEGRIFVDRFWRQKIEGSNYRAAEAYIRSRGVLTVQEMMKEPYWITTAPNCRHYFIPVETSAVLGNNPLEITRKKSSRYDYYKIRDEVFERMRQEHWCDEFNKHGIWK